MKTGTKVAIVAVVVVVLLMCCCVGSAGVWFFGFGPGSYQTAKANSLAEKADKKYKEAETVATQMVADTEDLFANVDENIDEAQIETLKDELMKQESASQEQMDAMDEADKYLIDAKNLRLPGWYITYLEDLLKRGKAEKEAFAAAQNGFKATREIVGSLAYVTDAVSRVSTAGETMNSLESSVAAGDFNGALATLNQADSSLAAAEKALKTAGETIEAKEIDDMIALIGEYRELLNLVSQFIQAAQALDLNRMTSLETQIETKVNETSAMADSMGVTGDTSAWITSVMDEYEKEFESKREQAVKYDKKAADLKKKNTVN